MMVNLTIDDKKVEVTEGAAVLRAAEKAGFIIPTLCDHPMLTPYGRCRLWIVEVEGGRIPQSSCTLQASKGLVIHTETPQLIKECKFILGLFMSYHNDAGYATSDRDDTEFMGWLKHYDMTIAALDPIAKIPEYKV